MSRRILIVREGGVAGRPGDVVIDARHPHEFYDVVKLGDRELRSLIAVGEVKGGAVVGWGKYTGRPVAAFVDGVLVFRAVPLTLYLEAGLLEKELGGAPRVDPVRDLVEKLKRIVVDERKRYKKSTTLLALQRYVEGSGDLPSYLADVLGAVDRQTISRALEMLYGEIY